VFCTRIKLYNTFVILLVHEWDANKILRCRLSCRWKLSSGNLYTFIRPNVSINSMGAQPLPGRLSGICHFGEKNFANAPHGVQIMQQNPHLWGLTLTQMPHPWGTKYKFSEDFWSKKSNVSSITYQYIYISNRFCSHFVSKRLIKIL
jgi:hypothetical protein